MVSFIVIIIIIVRRSSSSSSSAQIQFPCIDFAFSNFAEKPYLSNNLAAIKSKTAQPCQIQCFRLMKIEWQK